jgi:uncharacterized protein (TIGR00730 family)
VPAAAIVYGVAIMRVGVFCGSNIGVDGAYMAEAVGLGVALAGRGIGLVYGGAHVGLMGAVADGALGAGGEVIGVITEHLVGAEIAHAHLTSLEVVASMHERKARMSDLADGFIILPGGFGTLDETLELLTWNQLGLLAKPVVFLDLGGFFAPLFDYFDRAVEAAFIRRSHRALAQRAESVDDAIARALAPVPVTERKWIDRDAR